MQNVQITCRNCRTHFTPDLKARGNWNCPHCNTKNPHLRRHYKAVADVLVFGLVMYVVQIVISLARGGPLTLWYIPRVLLAVLMLAGVISIYRASVPWLSARIRTFIWAVFAGSFFLRLLLVLLRMAWHPVPVLWLLPALLPFLLIYGLIFAYLFWLRAITKRCST